MKSGPLARSETRKKGGKQRESQELVVYFEEWTTSWVRNREKGRKPGKRAENREKVRSQWPTLKSGPLAGSENVEKARKP